MAHLKIIVARRKGQWNINAMQWADCDNRVQEDNCELGLSVLKALAMEILSRIRWPEAIGKKGYADCGNRMQEVN
jgi:hypothetical protein